MSPKILICGATGMLGSDLVRHFTKTYGEDAVVATASQTLDVTDRARVEAEISRLAPTFVVNASAYTNVDLAETERDRATALNAAGPANLAEVCGRREISLFHYSTDQVFDGSKHEPWVETDAPRPLNHYAASKLEGERAVLAGGGTVLRVQWLYGDKKDRFTLIRDRPVFTPFDDQFGAPTWTMDIARVTSTLLEKRARGLYHLAYDDYASWFQIYQFVKEELGAATELVAKKTSDVKLPAARPLWAVMSNRKLCDTLGVKGLGSWKTPLSKFLKSKTA